MLAMIADWRGFLNSAIREEELRDLREHSRTGCPLGDATFVDRLERTGRSNSAPAKSRPSIEITQTAIIGSCPPNWINQTGGAIVNYIQTAWVQVTSFYIVHYERIRALMEAGQGAAALLPNRMPGRAESRTALASQRPATTKVGDIGGELGKDVSENHDEYGRIINEWNNDFWNWQEGRGREGNFDNPQTSPYM